MAEANSYADALALAAAAKEQQEHEQANGEAWNKIINIYPLRNSEANFVMIRDWCNGLITLAKFEELVRTQPSGFSLDAVSREFLINEILALSAGDANQKRELKFRLGTFSLKQLRDRQRELEFRHDVRTPQAAKLYIQEHRKETDLAGWNGTGFPRLGQTLVPKGEVRAVNTGQYLRDISGQGDPTKEDIWMFRRMCKLYSMDQCTWYMQHGA